MMENIFVVDTDIERRIFLYDVLMQFNQSVTTIPSLDKLLDAFKSEHPDFIIVEVKSNHESVKAILKKIQEINQNMRILVLVANEILSEIQDVFGVSERVFYLMNDVKYIDIVPRLLDFLKKSNIETGRGKVCFHDKVLIVDDDRNMSLMVHTYLEKRGYKVDTAFNGEEALVIIASNKPRVVILDIMMPGMDGVLVLKRIKEISNSIEVIVTSGIDDKQTMEKVLKLGAMVYLVKPFAFEELESAIVMGMIKPVS